MIILTDFKPKINSHDIKFSIVALSMFTAISGSILMLIDCGGPWYSCMYKSNTPLNVIGMWIFIVAGVICFVVWIFPIHDEHQDDVSSRNSLGK